MDPAPFARNFSELLLRRLQNDPAMLPDAVTDASEATATLLQRSPDAATAASARATERSYNTPRRCNCCFWSHRTLLQHSWVLQLLLLDQSNAPATLPDAATGAAGATGRSCTSPGHCKCYFSSHRTLLQCYQYIATGAARATERSLQHSQMLQLLLLDQSHAPATLLDATTGAAGATGRSCTIPGRCKCYFWSKLLVLQLRIYHPEPHCDDRGIPLR